MVKGPWFKKFKNTSWLFLLPACLVFHICCLVLSFSLSYASASSIHLSGLYLHHHLKDNTLGWWFYHIPIILSMSNTSDLAQISLFSLFEHLHLSGHQTVIILKVTPVSCSYLVQCLHLDAHSPSRGNKVMWPLLNFLLTNQCRPLQSHTSIWCHFLGVN